MFLIGALAIFLPLAGSALLGWENRDVVVRLHIGHYLWTGHLYAVLIAGALATCWFLLGVSCIRCKLAERSARQAPARREPGRRSRPISPALHV